MATVSASGFKARQAGTISLAGGAANTAHVVSISHPAGGVETHTVTTDGSGNASVAFVPQGTGYHSITVSTITTSTVASSTVACSGS